MPNNAKEQIPLQILFGYTPISWILFRRLIGWPNSTMDVTKFNWLSVPLSKDSIGEISV